MLIVTQSIVYLYALSSHSLKLSRVFRAPLSFTFSPSSDNLLKDLDRERECLIDQKWSMEFLQQPTFTIFFAIVLCFLVAKIVSFAVSNSTAHVNTAVSSVSEGEVAKDVILERELAVRRVKGEKRVKFVDDVMIRTIDRYEGSENLEFSDDVGEVEEMIVEGEKVENFGGDGLRGDSGVGEGCFDEREMDDGDDAALVDGSEETEMLFEKEGNGENDEGERKGGVGGGENEEIVAGDVVEEEKKVRDESIDDDDDWEGVEGSELEKGFAEAVNYVECGGKDREDDNRLMKLGSDVQMQLYGLHKVALEGPCLEPQPMALMVSSRAKWNAWQRLGSMSRDVAMEQYIQVLSQNIPEWMHGYSADDGTERKTEPNDEISVAENERKSEASPISGSSTSQSSVDKNADIDFDIPI